MNKQDGVPAGIEYGPKNVPLVRKNFTVGQGASKYRGEMIVMDFSTEDVSGTTLRSAGGAPTTPKVDFVLRVPVTRGVRNAPLLSTAIMLTEPDGEISGGNARGRGAIDLQYFRPSGSNRVAGGDSSVAIGTDNMAWQSASNRAVAIWFANYVVSSGLSVWESNNVSSAYGICIGTNNSTTTTNGRAFGTYNTSSGDNSTTVGGTCTANGARSMAIGTLASTQGISGRLSFSGINIAAGNMQKSDFTYYWRTTDATVKALTADNAAAGTTNQMILGNQSVYGFSGIITARQQGAGGAVAKVWEVKGAIRRGANAAATALVGTPTVTVLGEDAGAASWILWVAANTTFGCLSVTVVGAAATNIQWVGVLTAAESIYA